MRTRNSLLAIVLGDSQYATVTRTERNDSGEFATYEVLLDQASFRGFPPEWQFAVLDAPSKGQRNPETVFSQARGVIDKLGSSDDPIVLISDDPSLSLHDEFGADPKRVFCIDSPEIPQGTKKYVNAYHTPFMYSVRRRLITGPGPQATGQLSALDFSPYLRNKPVSGWRFFGRREELKALVHTTENYVIVGPRRVGKTSLMQEAVSRLKHRGERAHYIDLQYCRDSSDVTKEILRKTATRDLEAAIRRGKALDESALSSALKRLGSGATCVCLFLDEIGYVLANDKSPKFLGILRSHAQTGKLRVVVSCFQEIFLKQEVDFGGPLVNFATTLRLGSFDESEVQEALLDPIELWKPVGSDRKAISDLALSMVAGNPLLLQYFGWHFFSLVTSDPKEGPLNAARTVVRKDLVKCFSEPVEELFFRHPSPALQYIFLAACIDADTSRRLLRDVIIDDDWLEKLLSSAGYDSTLRTRRNLLEGLEIYGLTSPMKGNRGRQGIAAPAIFSYLKHTDSNTSGLLAKLRKELEGEAGKWQLIARPRIEGGL